MANPSLILSVWLHLLMVATWLGSMIFLAFALMPVLREQDLQPTRMLLMERLTKRLLVLGWLSLLLLFLTGLWNLLALGVGWEELTHAAFWRTSFGRTLMEKLTLFGLVLLLSAAHDFWVGPKAFVLVNGQPTPDSLKWRRQAIWIGRINLILGLLIMVWGVMLVHGRPFGNG